MKTDASRNVHLAWMGKTADGFDLFYSRWNGTRWSSPIKLTSGEHAALFPSMAIGPSGEVHLVWMGRKAGNVDIYYSRSIRDGWSKARNISNTKGISQRPQIAIDSSGTAQVIWYDKTSGYFALWHARGRNEEWTEPEDTKLFGWYVTDDPGYSLSVGLAADSGGNTHVIWGDVDLDTFRLFHCLWDGKAWGNREKASRASDSVPGEPTLASDPKGSLRAAWNEKGDVWYSRSDGGGAWSDAVKVSQDSDMPTLGVDSAGNVHLACIDKNSGQVVYRHTNAKGWSAPQNISKSTGTCAAPTVLIDASQAVHIAWMDDGPGNHDILYRRSSGRDEEQ